MPSPKFMLTVAAISIVAVMLWNKFVAPKTGVTA